MRSGADKRKQSVYLPDDVLAEIEAECERQNRSLSGIIQMAWKLARPQLLKLPGWREVT